MKMTMTICKIFRRVGMVGALALGIPTALQAENVVVVADSYGVSVEA